MITKASKCKATACIGFILMWNVWGIYLIENGTNQVTGRQVEICWLWYFLSNITIPSPTPPPHPPGVCVYLCVQQTVLTALLHTASSLSQLTDTQCWLLGVLCQHPLLVVTWDGSPQGYSSSVKQLSFPQKVRENLNDVQRIKQCIWLLHVLQFCWSNWEAQFLAHRHA